MAVGSLALAFSDGVDVFWGEKGSMTYGERESFISHETYN